MTQRATYLPDLAAMAAPPEEGILSRTVYQDDRVKVVVFGFSQGQELSEHTAAVPAVLNVVSGKLKLKLGDENVEASQGAWIHMPAGLPHALHAISPSVVSLVLLKSAAEA